MNDLEVEAIASLREGRKALDEEVRPILEDQLPDLFLMARLRDVADEYAGRARDLQQIMIEKDVDADLLEEVDQLCRYFDGTAGLIAERTGNADDAALPPITQRTDRG